MQIKSELRKSHRYLVNFPCSVKRSRGSKEPEETAIPADTKDVSTGGIYFEASANWQLGTEIECVLRLPVKAFGGRPVGIRCRGKIVRVDHPGSDTVGVGATIEHFEFLQLEKDKGAKSSKVR
ncbi:MAG: PilZ domain-containing protein [Acidobacteriota bacterium]